MQSVKQNEDMVYGRKEVFYIKKCICFLFSELRLDINNGITDPEHDMKNSPDSDYVSSKYCKYSLF